MTARGATTSEPFGAASRTMRALLTGALILFSGQLAAQTSVRGAPELQIQLNGTYVRQKRVFDAEEAARAAAIANVVARIAASARARWRAIIELSSLPEPRIEIANTATQIAIKEGDRAPLMSATSGSERTLAAAHNVTQQMEDGRLVQRISSSALAGLGNLSSPLRTVSRYEASKDRRSLTVTTEISGGDLPTPVVFRTTYARIDNETSILAP